MPDQPERVDKWTAAGVIICLATVGWVLIAILYEIVTR